MNRICIEAEREVQVCPTVVLHQSTGTLVEETIAYAAVSAKRKLDVKAIATLTQSGMTALLVSRLSVDLPIYAISPLVATRRKVTLFRGVYPVPFEQTSTDPNEVLYMAQDALKALGAVSDGDYIVVTIGEPLGKSGGTNSMKIIRVGTYRKA
jgi:pyruvate kinase